MKNIATYGKSTSMGTFKFIFILLILLSSFSLIKQVANANYSETKDPVVKYLMQQRGIDEEEAIRMIFSHERGSSLLDELKSTMPLEHGGVWIGEDDDRVKVGIPSTLNNDQIESIKQTVDNHELKESVDFVVVQHTFAFLKNSVKDISKKIRPSGEVDDWYATVGIRSSTNQVVVNMPEYMTSDNEHLNELKPIKEQYGDTVLIKHTLKSSGLTSCDDLGEYSPNYSPYCDRPLRGGVRISNNSGGSCSAGFIVEGVSTGTRYLLTAGHCAAVNNEGVINVNISSRRKQTGSSLNIGPVTQNKYEDNGVDAMIIRIRDDQSWNWTSSGWVFLRGGPGFDVAPPSENETWPVEIRGGNSNLENERVCSSGGSYLVNLSYRSSCGEVGDTDVDYQVNGFVELQNLVQAELCNPQGNSGGPVVRSGQKALGIMTANPGLPGYECSDLALYTGIATIINAFNNNIEVVYE